MEWWGYLTIILVLLTAFFLSALPVAFCFILFNMIAAYFWMGGWDSLSLLSLSAFASLASFPLVAVPLFIFMGELLFMSGVVAIVLDAATKIAAGIRGSLSFVAVGAGTLFGTMSGSAVSGVAVLGSTLAPEMAKRGYDKELALGPILGSGCLAMIIPPSVLAVLLGSLAQIPVTDLLVAGILPGLLLAGLYVAWILLRIKLKPALAPPEDAVRVGAGERVRALATILPILVITLGVWGVLLFGIATPSEAAAVGVAASLVVIAYYKRMSWKMLGQALMATVKISGMMFLIISSASAFGQILAFTGVSAKLVSFVTESGLPPMAVLLGMIVTAIILGTFMDELALLLIAIPIYMPVVLALKFDPVWFGLIMLLTIEIATISPPYGLALFVLKGVVPNATMADVWRASVAYMALSTLAIVIIVIFPEIATWLPKALR